MKEESLVSVGIPTYNRPKGLRRTLECITGQTYKNLEIIVSDNCSPGEGTQEVVREFIQKDPRVKYHRHENNKGPAFNFKFVLEKATGEYFMWAADDDEWNSRYIEYCIDMHKEGVYGCVFTRYISNSNVDYKKFYLNHNIYMNYKYGFIVSIFLDEVLTHKANIIYGIWKTDILRELFYFCVEKNGEYVGKGFDGAFVAYSLSKTRMYQVNEVLFFKKYDHYIPGSFGSFIKNMKNKIRTSIKTPKTFFKNLIFSSLNTYHAYVNLFPRKAYRFLIIPIKTFLVLVRQLCL